MAVSVPEAAVNPRRMVAKLDGREIAKGEIRKMPVAMLKTDSAYQREPSSAWVQARLPFDSSKANTVVVSTRKGGPYVVDGGHRVKLAHESGVQFINAFVVDDLTQAQEAILFRDLNRERTGHTSRGLYRAELVGQDVDTVLMTRIVHRAGFQLPTDAKSRGERVITAIDSVRWIFRQKDGPVLLEEVLKYIDDGGWVGMDKALSGPILKGLAIFLRSERQRAMFQPQRLRKVMSEKPPLALLVLAQQIAIKRRTASIGSSNVAEAMLEFYNKNIPQAAHLPGITFEMTSGAVRSRPQPKNKE